MIFFLILLIVCLALRFFGVDDFAVALFFCIMNILFLSFNIQKQKISNSIKFIILGALLVRIIFVVIDVYFMKLPHSGADDDAFYESSLQIYNNMELIWQNIYGGVYSKLLACVFTFTGPERVVGEFINVSLSIISIIKLSKISKNIGIGSKREKILLILFSFMPNIVFLNCCLRRDTFISFAIIESIVQVLKWFKDGNIKYAIMSVVFIIVAGSFHAAAFCVAPVYIWYYVLYNRKTEKIEVKGIGFIKQFFVFLVCCIVGLFIFNNFQTKFSSFVNMDSIFEAASYSRGDSAYLVNIKIDSLLSLMLFLPIKFVYFLISPMPWDFRNIYDIISFLMDSAVYLYFIIKILKNRKYNKVSKNNLFLYSFLVICAVFSIGTFTSGTAIRHRYNVLPFLAISGLCFEAKKENVCRKIEQRNQ